MAGAGKLHFDRTLAAGQQYLGLIVMNSGKIMPVKSDISEQGSVTAYAAIRADVTSRKGACGWNIRIASFGDMHFLDQVFHEPKNPVSMFQAPYLSFSIFLFSFNVLVKNHH
ncbi:MAG: hypothetical protein KDJ69_00425 [Nitratireductor sp.]|nr:hypothetical protein [Nitratireductor sp.]